MSCSIRRRALLAAALPAAVAAFALPVAADAAMLGPGSNGTLTYHDPGGAENNHVTVRAVGNEIVITDSVPFSPSPAATRAR
jgi:hypothetical protein